MAIQFTVVILHSDGSHLLITSTQHTKCQQQLPNVKFASRSFSIRNLEKEQSLLSVKHGANELEFKQGTILLQTFCNIHMLKLIKNMKSHALLTTLSSSSIFVPTPIPMILQIQVLIFQCCNWIGINHLFQQILVWYLY